jgi:hypothetical protein
MEQHNYGQWRSARRMALQGKLAELASKILKSNIVLFYGFIFHKYYCPIGGAG